MEINLPCLFMLHCVTLLSLPWCGPLLPAELLGLVSLLVSDLSMLQQDWVVVSHAQSTIQTESLV